MNRKNVQCNELCQWDMCNTRYTQIPTRYVATKRPESVRTLLSTEKKRWIGPLMSHAVKDEKAKEPIPIETDEAERNETDSEAGGESEVGAHGKDETDGDVDAVVGKVSVAHLSINTLGSKKSSSHRQSQSAESENYTSSATTSPNNSSPAPSEKQIKSPVLGSVAQGISDQAKKSDRKSVMVSESVTESESSGSEETSSDESSGSEESDS